MTLNILIRILTSFYFITAIGFSRLESIGLCISVSGQLERKGQVRNGIIRKGDSIYHGDKIKVEENESLSFVTIYGMDIVDIYENSVFKILNDKNNRNDFSEMALFGGKVIIKMDENDDRGFILNAPTAIINAEGSHFIAEYRDELLFNNNTYSVFTVLSGKIKVQNVRSGKIIYADKGETIISTRDGKFLALDTFKNSAKIIEHLEMH
tara:strand:- start:459 stop:1085 length:627 start_codon:yes stop_codon:yes gene_type:complete